MATPEKTYVARDTFAVMTRYRDAYKIANSVVTSGSGLKSFGIAIMVLSVFVGALPFLAMQGDTILRDFAELTIFGASVLIIVGLLYGYSVYIRGLLMAAQGQATLAMLDNAVSNSPFLTNTHRAKIFSLPGTANVQFLPETASNPASS